MALIIKLLGAGNANSATIHDLYTVPASKSALVSSARLVNVGANSGTASFLVLKSGGGNDFLLTKNLASMFASTSLLMEDPVTLGAGDKIRLAVGGATPSIDWQVYGVERDI